MPQSPCLCHPARSLVLNKAAAYPRRPPVSVAFSDFARPSPAPPPFHRALAGRTEACLYRQSRLPHQPSAFLKWGNPPVA